MRRTAVHWGGNGEGEADSDRPVMPDTTTVTDQDVGNTLEGAVRPIGR